MIKNDEVDNSKETPIANNDDYHVT